MIKPLFFNSEETYISKYVFDDKLIKLIYAIDVPSTASIWWSHFKGFDNIKLFPENGMSLQQEINYDNMLRNRQSDEPLIVITKSPFILQKFPNKLVQFAKLDDSSVTHLLPNHKNTYRNTIDSIIIMLGEVSIHSEVESVLNHTHKHK